MSKHKHPKPHPFLPTTTPVESALPEPDVAPPAAEEVVRYERQFGQSPAELKFFRETYLSRRKPIMYFGTTGELLHDD